MFPWVPIEYNLVHFPIYFSHKSEEIYLVKEVILTMLKEYNVEGKLNNHLFFKGENFMK